MRQLDAGGIEATHLSLFSGLGGGSTGIQRATASHKGLTLRYRCLGGIDSDPAAVRDFGRLTGTPGTLMDLFDEGQYRAWHGKAPPPGWREASPADVLGVSRGEHPDVVFLSPPCKGLSALMADEVSMTPKYQALNALTLRGVWLALEAYAADPASLYCFENVPRIATRGRALLDRICALFRHHGYAVAETTHDCGVIGNLAQSRRRFLLVARHRAKVPAGLFEAPRRRLRGVGEILGQMRLPGDPSAGPMHRIPQLQWGTWGRLAFVRPGSDWRSLSGLKVEGGVLADYALAPAGERRGGFMGVTEWDVPAGTVTSRAMPTNGCFSVADPRLGTGRSGRSGVRSWDEPGGAVCGEAGPGNGSFSVADPRAGGDRGAYRLEYAWAVVQRECGNGVAATRAACAETAPAGTMAVHDPRPGKDWPGAAVRPWGEEAGTVTGQRRMSVADPRPSGPHRGGGKYAISPWGAPSRTVIAASTTGNGAWGVAEDRVGDAGAGAATAPPRPTDQLVAVIRGLHGSWNRPFTTLELGALQSLWGPDGGVTLDGTSDQAHRERIGNAVPPDAARAIGGAMGHALLLAWSGEAFALSDVPLWVRGVAASLSLDVAGHVGHDAAAS